jgi:hypothetical protein
VYDDVVTINTVSTSDMIKKTTEAWELSLALGMPGDEIWYTGTFYSHADTYHELLKRGTPLRLHPCYEIDKENSRIDTRTGHTRILKHHMDQPVLYYEDHLQQLFTEMGFEEGSRTASMQMLKRRRIVTILLCGLCALVLMEIVMSLTGCVTD